MASRQAAGRRQAVERWQRRGSPQLTPELLARIKASIIPRVRPVCTFPGCGRPHAAHGLCIGHYQQRRDHPDRELRPLRKRAQNGTRTLCTFPGCGRPHHSHKLCNSHRKQRRDHPDRALRPIQRTGSAA